MKQKKRKKLPFEINRAFVASGQEIKKGNKGSETHASDIKNAIEIIFKTYIHPYNFFLNCHTNKLKMQIEFRMKFDRNHSFNI